MLEEQFSNSINKTMQGAPPTADQIGALVAYLTTLPAPSAPSDLAANRTAGNRRFNPPSLRGVGRRQSSFHDARASLTDVLTEHKQQLRRELSEAELKALLEFLRSI